MMLHRYDLFISYSHRDKKQVMKIVNLLKDKGYLIWINDSGVETGDIVSAIEECKVLVFFSSKHSNVSPRVAKEISIANSLNKRIILIRLDQTPFNNKGVFDIVSINYIDLSDTKLESKNLAILIATLTDILNSDNPISRRYDVENLAKRICDSVKKGEIGTITQGGALGGSLACANPIGLAACSSLGVVAGILPLFLMKEIKKSITFQSAISSKENKNNIKRRHCEVYSSIFAPAEVKRESHFQVQLYLHLNEEVDKVKSLAKESDKNAERRDYLPLSLKLRKGDKVDVEFNVYGETRLMSECKSIIWQGCFSKCTFDYFVPKDIYIDELSCVALLSVNGVPVGEMRFITEIVEVPRHLNSEIIAHKYNKVFISYSHQDESKVKFLHKGLELGSVPHFFDRKYLKAGDVFPQVIQDYINSADLFILCWSENASKSDYVQKERLQALERAFPQVQPEKAAKLRIYPISIEPRTELPGDMKNYYHFGEI